MSTYQVIAFKYLPPRLPILLGIVLWLLLDRLQPPGWVWGGAWTVYGLYVVLIVTGMFMCKHVHPSELAKR